MLSTEFLPLALVFLAFVVAVAGGYAFYWSNKAVQIARDAVSYAVDTQDWVKKHNAKDQNLADIAKLSAELTELSDAYHALLSSHKKLRSRIGMRENRAKANSNGADPGETYEQRKMRLRDEAKAKGYL